MLNKKSLFDKIYLSIINEQTENAPKTEESIADSSDVSNEATTQLVSFKTVDKVLVDTLQKPISKITIVTTSTNEEGEPVETPVDFDGSLLTEILVTPCSDEQDDECDEQDDEQDDECVDGAEWIEDGKCLKCGSPDCDGTCVCPKCGDMNCIGDCDGVELSTDSEKPTIKSESKTSACKKK